MKIAFAFLVPAAVGFVCENGQTPGPVHLQFAHFHDTAAFTNEDFRLTYRTDMLRVPNMLAAEFGTDIQYKLYYFSEKNEWGVHGCAWENSGVGFRGLAQFASVAEKFHSDLPYNEQTDRFQNYNSLSDALYYSIKSHNTGWIRSQVDSVGVPVVRIISVGTDIAASADQTDDLPDWPLNLEGVMPANCTLYDYPKSLKDPIREFPALGTYFIFQTITNLERPVNVPDVPKWYKDSYMSTSSYLGGVKGWSDKLEDSGHHADQTLALVRKAVCDYWANRPQIIPSTGYTCEDGTVPRPLHVQFAHFLDSAAFPNEDARRTYRTEMLSVPKKLVDMFGTSTEYKMYYFNDKLSGTEGCAYQAVGDGFFKVDEFYKFKDALFVDLNNNHLGSRAKKYTSLSDALYYSMKSPSSQWIKDANDADGVPILRIFSVGTDNAAWASGVLADKPQWPVELGTQPITDCVAFDYVDIEDRLKPAVEEFPEVGTYFVFLSQPGPGANPQPVGNIADWYRELYMPLYLGGVNGYSEEMPATLVHTDQILKLVQKAACDLSSTLDADLYESNDCDFSAFLDFLASSS